MNRDEFIELLHGAIERWSKEDDVKAETYTEEVDWWENFAEWIEMYGVTPLVE